jgi:hypothetical protein
MAWRRVHDTGNCGKNRMTGKLRQAADGREGASGRHNEVVPLFECSAAILAATVPVGSRRYGPN